MKTVNNPRDILRKSQLTDFAHIAKNLRGIPAPKKSFIFISCLNGYVVTPAHKGLKFAYKSYNAEYPTQRVQVLAVVYKKCFRVQCYEPINVPRWVVIGEQLYYSESGAGERCDVIPPFNSPVRDAPVLSSYAHMPESTKGNRQ